MRQACGAGIIGEKTFLWNNSDAAGITWHSAMSPTTDSHEAVSAVTGGKPQSTAPTLAGGHHVDFCSIHWLVNRQS